MKSFADYLLPKITTPPLDSQTFSHSYRRHISPDIFIRLYIFTPISTLDYKCGDCRLRCVTAL